jgi:hypothetical protein
MSKPIINRIFIGSLAAIVAGILLSLITVAAVLCTGTWTFSGSELTSFQLASGVAWTFGFAIVGGLLVLAGSIGQFVAWIGALVNTAQLPDKVWFVVLLVTGLLSFGFIAMLVYVLAGPDSTLPTGTRTPGPGGVQPAGS